MKDTTIVIQGSLNKISINNIDNYLKYTKVIISTWDDCDLSLIENIPSEVKIVKSKHIYGNPYNKQNFYCQCLSTLNGLLEIDTEYAIKVRGDESYSNCEHFINKIKDSKNKITTNNVFFRPDNHAKFHPSDHVMGGSTNDMIRLFCAAEKVCLENENKNILYIDDIIKHLPRCKISNIFDGIVAEQILCLLWLKIKNCNIDIEKSRELVYNNFEMVRAIDMGDFYISCRSCLNQENINYEQLIYRYDSIDYIEDL